MIVDCKGWLVPKYVRIPAWWARMLFEIEAEVRERARMRAYYG